MVLHFLQGLLDGLSAWDAPHALSLEQLGSDGPGAHAVADHVADVHHDLHVMRPVRSAHKVAFAETGGHKEDDKSLEQLLASKDAKALAQNINTPEKAQAMANMILEEAKQHEHDNDPDPYDPVKYMARRVDALEMRVKNLKEAALKQEEQGIGSSNPMEGKQDDDDDIDENLRGFYETEGGSKEPDQVKTEAADRDPEEPYKAPTETPEPQPVPQAPPADHAALSGKSQASEAGIAEPKHDVGTAAAESQLKAPAAAPKHEALDAEPKQEAPAREPEPSAPAAEPKQEEPPLSKPGGAVTASPSRVGGDTAECASADGRYKVVITPDGVRRLYDIHQPGVIQSRIQCDGDPPKGKGLDCGQVHWPCLNIHTPFRGYLEDITEQIQPLCKVPGWKALIIGLGGGFLQTNLERHCAHDSHIDTIETNPSVVPVAKNAMGFNAQSIHQHVQFGDGLQGAKDHLNAGDKYDFIFTDEASENSAEFLETAQQLLKPTGRFAISKLGNQATFSNNWLHTFSEYFAPAQVWDAKEGNHIMVTTPLPVGPKPKQVLATMGSHESSSSAAEAHAGTKLETKSSEKPTLSAELQPQKQPETKSGAVPQAKPTTNVEPKPGLQTISQEATTTQTGIKPVLPVSAQVDEQANATTEIKAASTVPGPSSAPSLASTPIGVASGGTANAAAQPKLAMPGSTEEAKE